MEQRVMYSEIDKSCQQIVGHFFPLAAPSGRLGGSVCVVIWQ